MKLVIALICCSVITLFVFDTLIIAAGIGVLAALALIWQLIVKGID
jgi:hypothetical protein